LASEVGSRGFQHRIALQVGTIFYQQKLAAKVSGRSSERISTKS
jgi:hypothetical protein